MSGRVKSRPLEAGSSLVGWMGLTVRVPEGWSPVAVSGEGEQGYLKVVSPDTRYLELKWEEVYALEHTPHPIEFQMYYSS